MSLATRCVNCGTVFRVVQDQLLVSEGWVRCGRCREVFNAIENMFDLRKDVPSSPLPHDADPSHPVAARPHAAENQTTTPDPDAWPAGYDIRNHLGAGSPPKVSAPAHGNKTDAPEHPRHQPQHEQVVRTSLWPTGDQPPWQGGSRRGSAASLRNDQDFQVSELTLDVPLGGGLPSDDRIDDLLVSNSRDTTFEPLEEPPEFIERARTESEWQQPRVRLALRIAAVLLCAALLTQLAMHSRDTLAARWPATESAFQALCAPFGCRVDAPRRLDALKLESTTFSDTGTPGLYRLVVALRNQDDARVKMPALDVKLLDARGETLTRRVVMSQELGARNTTLDALGEVTLQGLVRVGQANVSGYDVTVFYP